MLKACLCRCVQTDVVSSAGCVSLGTELQENGLMVSRPELAPIRSAQSMADGPTCLGPDSPPDFQNIPGTERSFSS